MSLISKKPLSPILLLVMAIVSSTALCAIAFIFTPQPLEANTMSLNQTEIDQKILTVPGWQQKDQSITRTFKFKDFVEAIDFVNQLVEPAEAAGHHPDLAISYNEVIISLTSHDAGGLTQKDFDLAQSISQLAK